MQQLAQWMCMTWFSESNLKYLVMSSFFDYPLVVPYFYRTNGMAVWTHFCCTSFTFLQNSVSSQTSCKFEVCLRKIMYIHETIGTDKLWSCLDQAATQQGQKHGTNSRLFSANRPQNYLVSRNPLSLSSKRTQYG